MRQVELLPDLLQTGSGQPSCPGGSVATVIEFYVRDLFPQTSRRTRSARGQVIEFRTGPRQSRFVCLRGLGNRVLEAAIIAIASLGIIAAVKGLYDMRC